MSEKDRTTFPQCPNCPEGRMSIQGDGCLWCDRCESNQVNDKPPNPADIGELYIGRIVYDLDVMEDTFEDVFKQSSAGQYRYNAFKASLVSALKSCHDLETELRKVRT